MPNKLLLLVKGQLALWTTVKRPDKCKWIFSSTDNIEFNYNSKYLFLYVKDQFKQVQPYYVVNDDKLRRELSERFGAQYFIETTSFRGMRNALKAGVWFTSSGLPVYALGSGKRHVIINLWHGIPLKKIVLLENKQSFIQKMYFKKMFSDNYKYILTTSHSLVRIMAESFGVSEDKVKVWGQPRNDVLFEPVNEENTLSQLYGGKLPEYRKAVLYAPTYREYGRIRLFPFEDMDMEAFEAFLERENIIVCIRTHIMEMGQTVRLHSGRILNMGMDVIEDVTEALPFFDLLITDYSSIYIDYLLLDRPIIFLPYDKGEYLRERGMNFDYDEVTPGDKPETFQDFLKSLEEALYQDGCSGERSLLNDRFNQVRVPCSEAICRNIWMMEE